MSGAGSHRLLAKLNQLNVRGDRFCQTETNKLPMMDVSPEWAARLFHTTEVNLNQMTPMVGYLPAMARVHAIDSKPKAKAKGKGVSTQPLMSRSVSSILL